MANYSKLKSKRGLYICKTVKRKNVDRYGELVVYISIFLNGVQGTRMINTGMKVKGENWYRGSFKGDNARYFNAQLHEIEQEIRMFYLGMPQKHNITPNEFVEFYKRGDYGVTVEDLLKIIVDLSINNGSKESTINKVNSDIKRIRRFLHLYDIKDISKFNQTILEDIGKHAIFKLGYKTSTVNQDLFKIVGAIRYLSDTGRINNTNHFRKFNLGKPVKKEHWSMTKKEIDKLLSYYNPELEGTDSNSKLNIALRWFLGMFYTGCNFDDMKHSFKFNDCLRSSEEGIRHFHFKRKKTGIDCYVPVIENKIEILQLFDGKHFNDFKNQYDLNYQLKKFSKLIKFRKVITSKIPRRSYGSIMIDLLGIDSVRVALGHKNRKTTENHYNVIQLKNHQSIWKEKNISSFL